MPLPPVQFQRQRRDPSLVEQALIGALSQYAGRKLIQEPLLRREAALEEEAAGRYREFVTERDVAEHQRSLERAGVEHGQRMEEIRTASEMAEAQAERGLPPVEVLATLGEHLLEPADVDFDETQPGRQFPDVTPYEIDLSSILFGARPVQVPRMTRRATADLGERLQSLAELRQRERALGAQGVSDIDAWLRTLYGRLGLDPSTLPPALVRDERTGDPRPPTDREQAIRAAAVFAEQGDLAGYGNHPYVRATLEAARELQPRLLDVPEYSPIIEQQYLGRFIGVTPGSEYAGPLEQAANTLRQVGLVGGAGRGQEWWFTNDRGDVVRARGRTDFLAEFPSQAPSRLRGVVWATTFFQDPSKFDLAKQEYGLTDSVAEETYRMIAGVRGQGRGEPTRRPTVGEGGEERGVQEPRYVSPAARHAVEAYGGHGAAALDEWVEDFLADPTAYARAVAMLDAVAGLPQEEFEREWLRLHPEETPPSEEALTHAAGPGARPPGTYGFRLDSNAPKTPAERDRWRVDMYSLLDAARTEAVTRRNRQLQEGRRE